MSGLNYVTQETLDQMNEELSQLKGPGRAEIARQIAEAREKGDDAAKEAQGYHEAKIARLQSAVASARVIDAKSIDLSKVSILSKVTIMNMKTKKSIQYQIVSEQEADLKAKKISVTSPMGKGLLGKLVGDIAEVSTPGGVIEFKVEDISI